jgi:hypothetical protein
MTNHQSGAQIEPGIPAEIPNLRSLLFPTLHSSKSSSTIPGMFLLLHLAASDVFNRGFDTKPIAKGGRLDISDTGAPQYFRVQGGGTASIGLEGDSDPILLNKSIFYRSPRTPFTILASDGDISFDSLLLPHGLESEWTIALSTDLFVNATYSFNESNYLSYVFYQSGASYRLKLYCTSPDVEDKCEIFGQEAVSMQICHVNETCDIAVQDGFYILAFRHGNTPLEVSVDVFTIKGSAIDGTDCWAQKVKNVTEPFSRWNQDLDCECEPENESVLIAVVLVVCLVVVLGIGLLIYYQCRPNREAYESNDDLKTKERSRLPDLPAQRGGSDGGYTAKSELMAFYD